MCLLAQNMQKMRLRPGLCPGARRGSSRRSPRDPQLDLGGSSLRGKEWEGMKGKGSEERRWRGGDGRGGEGPLRLRIPGSLFYPSPPLHPVY